MHTLFSTLFVIIGVFIGELIAQIVVKTLENLFPKSKLTALVTKLTLEGSKLDADLLAKLHALENGGHLATGTTATVIAAQTANPTAPTPAAATPPTPAA